MRSNLKWTDGTINPVGAFDYPGGDVVHRRLHPSKRRRHCTIINQTALVDRYSFAFPSCHWNNETNRWFVSYTIITWPLQFSRNRCTVVGKFHHCQCSPFGNAEFGSICSWFHKDPIWTELFRYFNGKLDPPRRTERDSYVLLASY